MPSATEPQPFADWVRENRIDLELQGNWPRNVEQRCLVVTDAYKQYLAEAANG